MVLTNDLGSGMRQIALHESSKTQY